MEFWVPFFGWQGGGGGGRSPRGSGGAVKSCSLGMCMPAAADDDAKDRWFAVLKCSVQWNLQGFPFIKDLADIQYLVCILSVMKQL